MKKQQREDLAVSIGSGVTVAANAAVLKGTSAPDTPKFKAPKLPKLKKTTTPPPTLGASAKKGVGKALTKAFGKGSRGRTGAITFAVVTPATWVGKQVSNKVEVGLKKRDRKKWTSKMPSVSKLKDYTSKTPKTPKVQQPKDFTKLSTTEKDREGHERAEHSSSLVPGLVSGTAVGAGIGLGVSDIRDVRRRVPKTISKVAFKGRRPMSTVPSWAQKGMSILPPLGLAGGAYIGNKMSPPMPSMTQEEARREASRNVLMQQVYNPQTLERMDQSEEMLQELLDLEDAWHDAGEDTQAAAHEALSLKQREYGDFYREHIDPIVQARDGAGERAAQDWQNATSANNRGTARGAIGGLMAGLAGTAALYKMAGGPGSGVSHDNTEFINLSRYNVKLSPYVSLQNRSRLMKSRQPTLRNQALDPKDISYIGQRTYVIKKLAAILDSNDQGWLNKPVQVLKVGDKYHLMDGHHRWLGALRRGRQLRADIWVMSEGELKQSGYMAKMASFQGAPYEGGLADPQQSVADRGERSPLSRLKGGIDGGIDISTEWVREVSDEARTKGYRAGLVTPTYRMLRNRQLAPSEEQIMAYLAGRERGTGQTLSQIINSTKEVDPNPVQAAGLRGQMNDFDIAATLLEQSI